MWLLSGKNLLRLQSVEQDEQKEMDHCYLGFPDISQSMDAAALIKKVKSALMTAIHIELLLNMYKWRLGVPLEQGASDFESMRLQLGLKTIRKWRQNLANRQLAVDQFLNGQLVAETFALSK